MGVTAADGPFQNILTARRGSANWLACKRAKLRQVAFRIKPATHLGVLIRRNRTIRQLRENAFTGPSSKISVVPDSLKKASAKKTVELPKPAFTATESPS